MSYTSYQEKLNQLRFLIQRNMAGNSTELSEKFEVSRRTIVRMLEQLRMEGMDFKYSRHSKKYIFYGEMPVNK